MLNKFIFLFALLILVPFALAETTVDVTSVAEGELVTITGTCSASDLAVGITVSYTNNNVYITQETSDAANDFSTQFLPSTNGDYVAYAACQGDSAVSKSFTVGGTPSDDDDDGGNGDDDSSTSSSSSSSGGGGCQSSWVCSSWSLCNSSLKQSRDCYDQNNCRADKTEVRDCDTCQESWTCSLWSTCANGVQSRTCVDQHYCLTTALKPALSRSCDSGTSAQYTPPQGEQPSEPTVGIMQSGGFKELWGKYGVYFLSVIIALVVILIIILLIAHFHNPKKVAYNHDELVQWVKDERSVGTSDEDIRDILSQKTGWTDHEIDEAFKEVLGPTSTGSLSG